MAAFRPGSPEIRAVSAELRDVLGQVVDATFDRVMSILRSRPVLREALETDPDTVLWLFGYDVKNAWRDRANAEHQARLAETAKIDTARRRERRARVPKDGAAWLRRQLETLNIEPKREGE